MVPAADHAAGVLLAFKAVALRALFLQGSGDPLNHAVLLRPCDARFASHIDLSRVKRDMPKILHFHLPKTGGTALRHHLVNQLGASNVSPTVVGMRLNDALQKWGDFAAVSGHFCLHHGDRLPSDRSAMTVLRDPIDRFLSEFFFAKSDNSCRLLDARKHTLDLDAYLERLSPQERESFSLQVEMLYPLGTTSQSALSADEKFTASVRALDGFDFLGLQDELDDSASMLDASYGWPPTPLAIVNATSLRISATELKHYQRKNLQTLLEPELDLYQHARNRFRRERRKFISRVHGSGIRAAFATATQESSNSEKTAIVAARNFGDQRCTVTKVAVIGEVSVNDCVMMGERLSIAIDMTAHEVIGELNIGIAIRDERGQLVFGTNAMLLGNVYSVLPGHYTAYFKMLNRVGHGRYSVDVALTRSDSHYDGCYHWLEQAAFFEVYEVASRHFAGRVLMDTEIDLGSTSAEGAWQRLPCVMGHHNLRSLGRLNEPLTQFRSAISPLCSPTHVEGGTDVLLSIRVENLGDEAWPTFGLQHVALSYRWLAEDGTVVVADGLRARLPDDVPSGRIVIIPLCVRVPRVHGKLHLVVSLVQEGVTWFVDRQSEAGYVFNLTLT